MTKWMKVLAEQHRRMRLAHPKDYLAVIFDIDDTILDLRHMIFHVLRTFDRQHRTEHFRDLALHDMAITETRVCQMISELRIPCRERVKALDWLKQYSWSPTVVRDAHRPFPGVMDVMRWLQVQPRTVVGFNTARPESLRKETLQCLEGIGRSRGVTFTDSLLYMSPYSWGERTAESKVEGIRFFEESGYRVTAFVDNEPENLKAVADCDTSGEILLLHADTVFVGEREGIPPGAVSGKVYDVTELTRAVRSDDGLGKAA